MSSAISGCTGSRTSTGRPRSRSSASGARPCAHREASTCPLRQRASLGREGELFEHRLRRLRTRSSCAHLSGGGGTGKTRFWIELARLLADEAEGVRSLSLASACGSRVSFFLRSPGQLGAASGEVDAIAARIGDKRTHLVCDNVGTLCLVWPDPSRSSWRRCGRFGSSPPAARGPRAGRVPSSIFLRSPSPKPLISSSSVRGPCAPGGTDAHRLRALRTSLTGSPSREPRTQLDRRGAVKRAPRPALRVAATPTSATRPSGNDRLGGTTSSTRPRAAALSTPRPCSVAAVLLGSADAVCEADLDTLESLLDKSLIRRRAGRLGEARYWMLETIRAFALRAA